MNHLALITLIFFTLLAGCGTDTGNPFHSGDSRSSAGDTWPIQIGEEPFSFSLAKTVCSKLSQCHADLTFSACTTHFYLIENIDTEVGLPEGTYSTINAIYDAEKNEEIVANTSASAACINDYNKLTCSDVEIVNSWIPENSSPMLRFAESLPTSCINVFQ